MSVLGQCGSAWSMQDRVIDFIHEAVQVALGKVSVKANDIDLFGLIGSNCDTISRQKSKRSKVLEPLLPLTRDDVDICEVLLEPAWRPHMNSTEKEIIPLSDILYIKNPTDYKVHLASWNHVVHPLDVFLKDRDEWKSWNEWRSMQDDFNRQYIFTLIDYYHEHNVWLFGGIYEVVKRLGKTRARGYEVDLTDQYKSLIGRLKVHFERGSIRQKSITLERYLDAFTVHEILSSEYKGEAFPGYEDINHDFSILDNIFKTSKPDWKYTLENVKGVYLIADKSNGKKYVGSAYGESGIWSRWSCYMRTGDGNNDELTKLIHKKGMDYAQKNFRFVLLEYHPKDTEDKVIRNRESYWKKALLSREFGYNKN